jgi:hypothetical protein
MRIHLSIAAFFLPALLLMAVSGGLYLNGFKGSVESMAVEVTNPVSIDPDSPTLKQDIDGLLQSNGVVHNFEYVKISGSTLTTRPTSREYYTIDVSGAEPTVALNKPDLIKRLVELHKGHGPGLFKTLQMGMAVGLVVVLLTGFWLGLSSVPLRNATLGVAGTGIVVVLLLTTL